MIYAWFSGKSPATACSSYPSVSQSGGRSGFRKQGWGNSPNLVSEREYKRRIGAQTGGTSPAWCIQWQWCCIGCTRADVWLVLAEISTYQWTRGFEFGEGTIPGRPSSRNRWSENRLVCCRRPVTL